MVAISHKNPLDDEDGVFEGVVMERARRCLLSFMNSCLRCIRSSTIIVRVMNTQKDYVSFYAAGSKSFSGGLPY